MKQRTDRRRLRRLRYSIAILTCAAGGECLALDKFWNNASGGTFNVGSNWLGGVVPGASDVAHFGLTTNPASPISYIVDFVTGPSITNQAIKVEDDLVTFELANRTYATTLATGNEIGNVANNTGQLTIRNGFFSTNISSDLSIGVNANCNGAFIVGVNSQLLGPPVLNIGKSGAGTLSNVSGGRIAADTVIVATNAGSSGTLLIAGAGTNTLDDFVVGNSGAGTMLISSGGTLSCTGILPTLGMNSGSTGRVDVTGAGSQWINTIGTLTIGKIGVGTMNVFAGALVQNVAGIIGDTSPGTGAVVVNGAGSRWINSSTLTVGRDGRGTLSITGGGTVQSSAGLIGGVQGVSNSGRGLVIVDGPGSRWSCGALNIGAASTSFGTLIVGNGGVLETTSARLGLGGTAAANVGGAGARWTNTGTMVVGGSSLSNEPAGSLTVGAGGLVETGDMSVGFAANSPGLLIVSGASAQLTTAALQVNGGTMLIQLGGLVDSTEGIVQSTTLIGQKNLVTGAGSRWHIGTDLSVGVSSGALDILDAATVQNRDGFIGGGVSGTGGTLTVAGAGAQWTNTRNVYVGGGTTSAGTAGTLNVNPGGIVTLDLFLTIWDNGTVNLNGGTLNVGSIVFKGSTFEFNAGKLAFNGFVSWDDSFADKILGSGHTIGPLQHVAVAQAATLNTSLILNGGSLSTGQLINPSLLALERGTLNLTSQIVNIEPGGVLGSALDLPADLTINVNFGINNRGLVRGDGQIGGTFNNDPAGELRAEPGKSLTLTGAVNNNGRINLLGGGVLEFTQTLTNNATGVVSGNGTVIAKTGVDNSGSMSFSGQANIVGDVTNTSTGKILCTGGGPTTFFDDVVNNGEIRTSLASISVFLGSVTGAGSFSGPGTKLFEAGSSASLPGLISPGNTVVEATALLSADLVREKDLTVRGQMSLRPGNAVSRLNTITIEDSGVLDLNDNDLIIDNTPLATVAGYIAMAFNAGNWNGPALTSSSAAMIAANNLNPHKTALGYAAASSIGVTSFDGQSIAGSSVLVRYTYTGDANLDGTVNALDFNALASSFGGVSNAVWSQGDFNFDGAVNSLDFNSIAVNFNQALPASTLGTLVPEPALLYCAACGSLSLLLCRNRRRRHEKAMAYSGSDRRCIRHSR